MKPTLDHVVQLCWPPYPTSLPSTTTMLLLLLLLLSFLLLLIFVPDPRNQPARAPPATSQVPPSTTTTAIPDRFQDTDQDLDSTTSTTPTNNDDDDSASDYENFQPCNFGEPLTRPHPARHAVQVTSQSPVDDADAYGNRCRRSSVHPKIVVDSSGLRRRPAVKHPHGTIVATGVGGVVHHVVSN